jgi:[protein-PII] uridylyltransferase
VDPGAVVDRLTHELSALDRAYAPGAHGRWSARRRSGLVDAALIRLYEAASADLGSARTALVALGGYGRAALSPGSDLDVLVLHDGSDTEAVTLLAERLLYPLWDAGFRVGHAARTEAECREAAADRLETLTASLDMRLVAGDVALFDRAAAAVLRLASHDVGAFARRLVDGGAARRARYGAATHRLEPDLKESAGGLRDVQTVGWLERAVGPPLEDRGLIHPRERAAIEDAEEFLTRARSALHLLAPGTTDRLIREHQADVAAAMGFTDEPRLPAVDGLMRAVFEHARQALWIRDAVVRRLLEAPERRAEPIAPMDPEGLLVALADLAETGGHPSVGLLDAATSVDPSSQVAWTESMRDALSRILHTGEGGTAAFEVLDRLGLLVAYLPAWAAVRCRPQRDPYHRYSVDTHLLRTAAGVAGALRSPDPDDPIEAEAAAHVDDADGVLLGALLHDIGKIGEGNHVPAGSRIATEALRGIGVGDATAELAAFMVREHLLLPDTATRRDLSDDDLILDVAATIGTPERLAALYLLAKADATATGSAAWTPWRRTLIRELVGKVQRSFERGDMGTELAGRLAERVDRLRELLVDQPQTQIERFILRMPRAYFLTVEPARAARHFAVIAPRLASDEVRTQPNEGSRPGVSELLVVAADRAGLLARIAGSLAVAGLSIVTAQVFTTEDGAAVDLFEVQGVFERQIDERRWREFRNTLRKAIDGRVDLEHQVREKRAPYPPPKVETPVTVEIDDDASEHFTVVEVGAPDRLGLLFDIATVFAARGLDVHVAKVATYAGRVVDAFYVRDAVGRKLEDPDEVGRLERALRDRLGAAQTWS